MALPKQMTIKESKKELKALEKNQPQSIIKRLHMLIEIKKAGTQGISRRDLAKRIGVDPNSIQSWRSLYIKGGINAIISHGRIGFKPSQITAQEHKKIEKLLQNPSNGIRGYKELQEWVQQEFTKTIKYTTLYEYVNRHFGAKIKVGRKSHVHKDEALGKAFKKTFRTSSKR